MKGYMYILECADQSFYIGSTIDLIKRFNQHQTGQGSNHTMKRLPVKLVYYEEFEKVVKHSEEKNKFKNGQEPKRLLS